MVLLEKKIDELKKLIDQLEKELEQLIDRREEAEEIYYRRLDEINLLEDDIDSINEEIDERVILMDESREEALGYVEVFKNMPTLDPEEKRELATRIKASSNGYKEEKKFIEKLLDELDELENRVDYLDEIGDKPLIKLDEEIVNKDNMLAEVKQELNTYEVKLHEMIVEMIDEIIMEIKKRSAGNACTSLEGLKAINPDLSDKIDMLHNKAESVLGMSLEDYFILEKILK